MEQYFNPELLKCAQVFNVAAAPLGDKGPRCRLLSIDYKDQNGVDCSQDIAVGAPQDVSDERLVNGIRGQYAVVGFSVSAITEVIVSDDGTAHRALYIKPGFLEECIMEVGSTVPQDMAPALEAMGIHPVNWDELVQGWETAP